MKAYLLFIFTLFTGLFPCYSSPDSNADIVFILGDITDSDTREHLAGALAKIPKSAEGVPRRLGIKLPSSTTVRNAMEADIEVRPLLAGIETIARATHAIPDSEKRTAAERELAAFIGISRYPGFEMEESIFKIVSLHERDVSYEAIRFYGPMVWNYFWKPSGKDIAEASRTAGILIIPDVPWIVQIVCDHLVEFRRSTEFGSAGTASVASTTPDIARALCSALGTKYAKPRGSWNGKRLRAYAIKQLRRAAKRPNLAPADAEAIATALHQLETFQPDPMNAVRL